MKRSESDLLCAFFAASLILSCLSQAVWAAGSLDSQCAASGSKTLCADEAQYLPGTIAFLSGNGYTPGSAITIKVTRPDGSTVTGDGSGAPWPTAYDTVTADDEGYFTFHYAVNGTAGAYQVEVMEGLVVSAATSINCLNGAKAFVADDAVTTSTTNTFVTLDWQGTSGDPTQVRFANDLTPLDGCSNLGGGSYGAWQPVIDADGSKTETFPWTLQSGANGDRKVCVESAKGPLNNPVDSTSDPDAIRMAVSNPPLTSACGLDIVLVIDTSGSVDEAQLAQSKAAFVGFVNALIPDTPTEIAVVEYNTVADIRLGFSTDKTLIIDTINGLVRGGWTNWDDALFDARSLFPGRADNPDLILFSSDGNPNRIGGHLALPEQSASAAAALAAAVVEADAAKTAGVRIETIGIGSSLNIANLEAISSPDAVTTSGFDTLANDLAGIAVSLCGGTITVTKLVDADGDLGTVGDQTLADGWTFTTNVDPPDTSTPTSGNTSLGGQINFDIDVGDDLTAVVDITETQQAGFGLLSASCTVGGNPVGTPIGNAVNDITVTRLDIVTCTFINSTQACGNGIVNAGEQCDDGNTADGDCCSSSCQFESPGAPCGNQTPEGACDLADVCDGAGVCDSNRVSVGGECRAAAGLCDVPETCDGVSVDCPSDDFQPSSIECRASAGDCDPAESCTGTDPDCPVDLFAPSSTECRMSAGECDPAEFCTGSDPACPTDVLDNTTVCRVAAGDCDTAEVCDGTNAECPPDGFDTGSVCRPSAGVCDLEEVCDGTSADCPADVLDDTSVCRPAAGECDIEEICNGTDVVCPPDALRGMNAPCGDDGNECTGDVCSGVDVFCTHPDNQECGACCLPDATCRDDLTDPSCEGLGGTFVGTTQPCNGDTDGDGVADVCDVCPGVSDADFAPECQDAIPAVSQWGLIILALLLLVSAKVYFGRRTVSG